MVQIPINASFRFLLFVSSYFPALLILFFLQLDANPWIAFGSVGIGCVGLLGLAATLAFLRRLAPRWIEVERRRGQESEVMSYVVTYLIPFVTGMLESDESALAFLVFFVVIGLLYSNSNMIQINPMLNLAGYRVYRIEGKDSDPTFLLTRRRAPRGERIAVVPMGEDIFLEVTRDSSA